MAGDRRVEIEGAAHLVLAEGVAPLHPEEAVFEAMLDGWRTQQQSRYLKTETIEDRLRLVRRFAAFTNEYPWRWTPADVEDWTSELVSEPAPIAHSTVRAYQQSLAGFLDYVTDRRYGWAAECEERFGCAPVQICHEWNTLAHRADYEGRPGNRPLTRAELQRFLDFCDEKVARARRLGRKGWLAAFRDATLFKAIYAWGLRRTEAARLDVSDFTRNPAAPELGRFGMLSVRWGKASRGGPPRRRNVCTVFGWAAEAVEQYLCDVRPLYGNDSHPALWLTERGGRVSVEHVNARFAEYRDALGLAGELGPHCLRHSYVTHLIEDGFDALFVQQQVGHAWASTTALYTGVSGDFKNRVLRAALDRAFAAEQRVEEGSR
jgi:site-specific recombinase XerD